MGSNATPTPSDEMPLRPGRRGHPKRAHLPDLCVIYADRKCEIDVDVESEDESEDDSSTPSTTYAPTRLTQRQAALAGIADSSEHMVLGRLSH